MLCLGIQVMRCRGGQTAALHHGGEEGGKEAMEEEGYLNLLSFLLAGLYVPLEQ